MPAHAYGLVLEPDDLTAARRCAHEALVLAVDELHGAPGDRGEALRGRVLARAGAVHALGTETDGDRVLVLVSEGDAAALIEGARDVERDLAGSTDAPASVAAPRQATVAAARRVRVLLGDRPPGPASASMPAWSSTGATATTG